jgi:hypothetical protein
MFSFISGVALIGVGGGSLWYLLPRKGRVHPLVRNSDVGSMITIVIMSVLIAGIAFLTAGIFG